MRPVYAFLNLNVMVSWGLILGYCGLTFSCFWFFSSVVVTLLLLLLIGVGSVEENIHDQAEYLTYLI